MSAAHVLLLEVTLAIPAATTLKDRRRVVRSLIDRAGAANNAAISLLEADDDPRRAKLGIVVVGGSSSQVRDQIDGLERLCWSRPEIEVRETERTWMEVDR
ncbi:MAG: DUF503 domain-containing protein [Acidobacteria bacterium]|nr:DUF503 domain-containing protein [Acidobacteriota bacterium]